MSAFWNKSNKDDEKSDAVKKVVAKKSPVKAKDAKKAPKVSKKKQIKLTEIQAELVNRTLIRPRISEDAMNKQLENKFVFEVSLKATKNEISKAITALYGVEVEAVNTQNYKKQNMRFRGHAGKTKAYKKAIVKVKEGQSIELFKEAK